MKRTLSGHPASKLRGGGWARRKHHPDDVIKTSGSALERTPYKDRSSGILPYKGRHGDGPPSGPTRPRAVPRRWNVKLLRRDPVAAR